MLSRGERPEIQKFGIKKRDHLRQNSLVVIKQAFVFFLDQHIKDDQLIRVH